MVTPILNRDEVKLRVGISTPPIAKNNVDGSIAEPVVIGNDAEVSDLESA